MEDGHMQHVSCLEKSNCVIELQAELAGFYIFSWNTVFYLKERLANSLLRHGYLVDNFLKMNKVSPSLKKKQLTVFVANDKFVLPSKN